MSKIFVKFGVPLAKNICEINIYRVRYLSNIWHFWHLFFLGICGYLWIQRYTIKYGAAGRDKRTFIWRGGRRLGNIVTVLL